MRAKKTVWIDFSPLQIDVMIAQLYLAKERFELHVISTKEVVNGLPKDLIAAGLIKSATILPKDSKFKAIWTAFKQIKSIDADYAVMNDGQGQSVKWLSLLGLFLRTEFIGVHHNADKFIFGSLTQSLINLKIKKYFVLAEYILKNLNGKVSNKFKFSSFYSCLTDYKLLKNENPAELKIAIPGFVEFHRRDYLELVENLSQGPEKLASNIKFVILGNAGKKDGQELIVKAKAAGLENNFSFYDHFVPLQEMYQQIDSSDLLMTLIGPKNQYFDLYKKYKISGTYSLSIMMERPLLLHEVYSDESEFNDWAMYYTENSLVKKLNQWAKDKSEVKSITQKSIEKFKHTFTSQSKKYCDFIEKNI
ncbi:hypothetical protein CIK05_10355 [Bdellovibrio sp. qaytius]|nr:hypothetical protein CIK05_10355 [Bdellovibrio sp. qaytius]